MFRIIREIWEDLTCKEPVPETIADAMRLNAERFPDPRLRQELDAKYELERRQGLGLRRHDA